MKQKFRNKGAISLEYILVIVVVVLVSMTAMKLFGGRVGDTVNNSKDAVVNTTNNVFNQLEGSGESGGSGGSALVNVGPIYEMRPVMGLHTENQKTQMINNGIYESSQFEPFTGTAYKYSWTFDFTDQAGDPCNIAHKEYSLSDDGTKYAVLLRIPGEDRTSVHTGFGTSSIGDSAKTFADATIGDTLTVYGDTWEVLLIETSETTTDNPTNMFLVYDKSSYLTDEATKAEVISNGANEYWFKLWTGDVYRYTRGYYKESRLYFIDLEDHRTLSFTTEGPTVGEVYDGSTVIDAGWEDGEKVAHE